MDYSKIIFGQLNPFRKTIPYIGEANAPVLYNYDSSGFISSAQNRNVTIQDGLYINEYNQRVATRLQEQDTTLNQLLQQTMPNWQPVAKDLNFLSNPTANYSNEGRNYQTPTYNFGPNHRGNGFTDPHILDNSGGYRGLNTYSGVYASQAAENAAFERDWDTAINAYSTQPSYISFPTDPGAYVGLEDAFGNDWETPSEPDYSYDFGGYDDYYDYSYDYSYDYYDYSYDWYPMVIDLTVTA
jgi:hypothetical protein